MTVARRLELHVSLLELIARLRNESGDEHLGSAIEGRIIGRELRDLEAEILANPGPLKPALPPPRPKGRR